MSTTRASSSGARPLKVGELARRSGVSVRTLHYYEEIGLLSPSEHTPTGHRLYAAADVSRLQQIVSLRHLGLSLAEIRDCLDTRALSPGEVVARHLDRVREQIALQQALCERLERVARTMQVADAASVDDLLQAIEVTKMVEAQFTPEQRALFDERAKEVGAERIREVEAAWPVLIAEVRAAMADDTDPASERAQQLIRRWQSLGHEFHGDHPELIQVLRSSVTGLPERDPAGGIDQEMIRFVYGATQAPDSRA